MADVYIVDEYDASLDFDKLHFVGDEVAGIANLKKARSYFLSASGNKKSDSMLEIGFGCKEITAYKSSIEISTKQTDNIRVEPHGFKSNAEMYQFFVSKVKTLS